jgi:hypothetical protein
MVLGRCGRRQRGVVPAKPVVEASGEELDHAQGEPLPPRLRLAERSPSQLGELGLATSQRSQRQAPYAGGDDPGRLSRRAQLLVEDRCRSQLTQNA